MLRRLSGCAVALALLVPAPLASLSPASAAPSASTSAGKPGTPLTRDVRLGHRPVRYADPERSAVKLTFRARKGQLVELARWSTHTDRDCFRSSLRRESGRAVTPWATGYWRLPRTGTYTATLRPCHRLDGRVKVQVRKVVVQDSVADGPATTVGADPDVTHLVRVPLGTGDRLNVRAGNNPRHLVLPDRRAVGRLPSSGWFALEAGDPLLRWDAGAGSYYVAARPGSAVSVQRAVHHEATLDGPAVPLADGGAPGRTHLVSFTAQAGQWVYGELLDGAGNAVSRGSSGLDLRGPALAGVSGVLTSCPGQPTSAACSYAASGPWLVTTTGTHRMEVVVSPTVGPATLRVRTAAVAPELTVDGPAVTYTATTPGQWVVGPYTEGLRGYDVQATASNATAGLTDWRMTLASGFPATSAGPRSCNGCGDYLSISLIAQTPSDLAPRDQNAGPSMAVLTVPPGVTGSLEVRLTRR